jgi:hypothetical protein
MKNKPEKLEKILTSKKAVNILRKMNRNIQSIIKKYKEANKK